MIDYATLMTQAAMLRNRLGEDSYSPIDVFALALGLGELTLVFYPLGENLSGMCVKGKNGSGLVAINSTMTRGRQRFSLSHEFYHLYYDDSTFYVCSKKIGSGKDVEKSADAFASYFLMPDAALSERAAKLAEGHANKELSLEDVIRIEQYFGVSHQAAVYRLMHTPYLCEATGNDYLGIAVRRTAEKLGYASGLYLPLPEGRRYGTYGAYIRRAQQLVSRGLISQGRYEELLMDAFRPDLVYGDDGGGGDVVD